MFFNMRSLSEGRQAAEPIPGNFSRAIDALAKEFGLAIAVGMHEAVDGDTRVFNTVYVTSSAGEQTARYRKVHLFEAIGFREADVILPSRDPAPVTFDIGTFRFGIMTCYDLRFPESARALVDAGASAMLLPSLWMVGPQKLDHWTTLVRARAIENTVYLVASNASAPVSFGHSMLVDPSGVDVAVLAKEPQTHTVPIEKSIVEKTAKENPSVLNRRFRVERI